MKRKYLMIGAVLLAVAVSGAENKEVYAGSGIPIDATHFPDAEFRELIGSSSFDDDQDGLLSEDEIQNIGYIDCENKDIRDLTGIEYFTELRNLKCNFNDLSTLDLTHNRKLSDLECGHNQLKTLKINNEENMNGLYCDNNFLTTIDFGETPYIDEISANKNRLTELILPECHTVLCRYNELKTLDTTKGGTDLKRLYCAYNDLTSLDVSANPMLRYLDCSYNQLTELKINKKYMSSLNCSYNRLTDLDFRKNKITDLYCNNNFITSIKVERLRRLECANNSMEELDLSGINGLWSVGDLSQYKVKYVDVPELTHISRNKKGVKISWRYPKQCDGFNVYRKIKGGSWKKIHELRKKECTGKFSYTDSAAKRDKTYVYTVRAVRCLGDFHDTEAKEKDYLGGYDKKGLTIKGGKS